MAKYGNVIYGGARYGDTPKLAYSVEPMSIEVLKFNEVYLNWYSPTGTFSRFRIVRNQNGFPETAEDGVVVYEVSSSDGSSLSGTLSKTILKDGEENVLESKYIPITPGRPVYYRVFLYTAENIWVKAGEIYDVVPTDTDATKRLMNLLPRTLVSDVLSPFGVIPEKTDPPEFKTELYQFLDGMAFTYEQLLTQLSLLKPAHNVDPANYLTIPAESFSVGIEPEPNLPVVNQRRLIREANYLYGQKGTALGIKNYSQALTGFLTNVNLSHNLLLSVQDSTFYKSTGNWAVKNSTATISSTNELEPDLTEERAIDKVYTLKINASDAGHMVLGYDSPLLQGIPISSDNIYTYSFKVKSPTSAGSVTPTIAFFDKNGLQTYTTSGTPVAANNSWKTVSDAIDASSDLIGKANYAGLKISWSAAGVYYVDMVCLQKGTEPSYFEARHVDVILRPSKTNFITNPSFEVNDAGWERVGIKFERDNSTVPKEGYPSTYSGKFTASSTTWELKNTSRIPLLKGAYFNVSLYGTAPSTINLNIVIDVYDAEGTLLYSFTEPRKFGPTWTRISAGGLINLDTEADYALVKLTGTATAGDTFHVDMVQAQTTKEPSDYFDGSMPTSVGVIWQGDAHASNSLYYPGKDTKISRLAHTLNDWVPMNTWWRVLSLAGVEYTNLDV